MDWFERLTGFAETDYAGARAKLAVEGSRLSSLVNGASYAIGELEVVSLAELRARALQVEKLAGKPRVHTVVGDVRLMHRRPENAGALFQVASQFNVLEMTSPEVTPEQGITRYQYDRTQGPACAIAAGAATLYRNYFVPVGGGFGQTKDRQIDCLADVGAALSRALNIPVPELWRMRNGYALCTRRGLDAIGGHLNALDGEQTDRLRRLLRIGLHWDVEAMEAAGGDRPLVSQAFCSALSVAYSAIPPGHWERFARLVLEAAYEATIWAAVANAQRGVSNQLFLTLLGGGAFGNAERWIQEAMRRALGIAGHIGLNVAIVSYGDPSRSVMQLVEEFQ